MIINRNPFEYHLVQVGDFIYSYEKSNYLNAVMGLATVIVFYVGGILHTQSNIEAMVLLHFLTAVTLVGCFALAFRTSVLIDCKFSRIKYMKKYYFARFKKTFHFSEVKLIELHKWESENQTHASLRFVLTNGEILDLAEKVSEIESLEKLKKQLETLINIGPKASAKILKLEN